MPKNLTIALANRIEEISRLGAQVQEFGTRHRLSGRTTHAVNLALEELVVNIISYAWDDGGEHRIEVSLSVQGRKLAASIRDDGKPFNPLAAADVPNPAISIDQIEDLELGLRLVRMMVDCLHYVRKDGCNILTLSFEDAPGKKTITSMQCEERVFLPPAELSARARIRSLEEYRELYRRSIADPEGFWAEKAAELRWFKKWDQVLREDFAEGRHEWFVGGKLNVSVNCLDRHLEAGRGDKAALLWEGERPGEERTLSYRDLHREVCRFANVLRRHGVGKGDRVSLYLPLVPELAIGVLACARIGAIHSVVFGGFSADALRDRILDCDSKLLVCSDGYARGGKLVRSKEAVDAALRSCPGVKTVVVVRRADCGPAWQAGRDTTWDEEMAQAGDSCEPEVMDAEDPLFILHTSGSTGKPKGVLHTSGGYLVYTMQTFKYVFDIRDDDVYWCTADIGWITGHSYLVYGPLANGATCVMYEGAPTYPRPDRFWEIIARRRVSIFYTAPTALRALMKEGDEWPRRHDLSSLRLLGTVGEPINPEAWMWYYETIGGRRCPIVDTWWQTETGGIMVSPLPGATPIKPGSAALPFFGIEPSVIRDDMTPAAVDEGGWLVIKRPWPGLMRRVYGDPARFRKTYFSQFHGVYTTGDGARLDKDGYLWLMGRIDDVINVSGHRLGTAEIESALVSHHAVAEAAVVGMPHEIKGQGIYAFVSLKIGVAGTPELARALTLHVRGAIGALAAPDRIQFAEVLPKTRSGKIMRRILTRIAAGEVANLGDTTTLTDPDVVAELVRQRSPDGPPAFL